MKNKTIQIHTISDSTGETVQGVARAVRVQFENVEQVDWTLVKTGSQIEKIGEKITKDSIVIYTMGDEGLTNQLQTICNKAKAKTMPLLNPLNRAVKLLGGIEKEFIAGAQHALDAEYFARVEAIDFAVNHDDGLNNERLGDSDIILIGASRTSKSPTSIYLANKGIKTGNIPFVNNIDMPETLFNLPEHVLVVGLTRDAQSLVDIRRSRLNSLNATAASEYTDINSVEEEVLALKRLCSSNGWAVINVSTKSIEETATQIIKYYGRHQDNLRAKKEQENDQ